MKPADPADPAASHDRTTQALMSVLDDLSVQREESGLLRSTLEHVVLALEATGGLTLPRIRGGPPGAGRAAPPGDGALRCWPPSPARR